MSKLESGVGLFQAALLHHQAGRLAEAVDGYQAAVAIDPADRVVWNNLGSALSGLGRQVEAVDAFLRAIALDAGYAAAWFNLGTAYQKSRRFELAYRAYHQALILDPDDADGWYNSGVILDSISQYGEAAEAFRKVMMLAPERAQAYLHLSRCAILAGDFSSAQSALQAAKQRFPNQRELLNAFEAVLADVQEGRRLVGAVRFLMGDGEPGDLVRKAMLLPAIPRTAAELAQIRPRMLAAMAAMEADGVQLQDPAKQVNMTPFYLAYHGESDVALQCRIAEFFLSICPALGYVAPHCQD